MSWIRFKVGDLVYCSYWSWYKKQYGQDPIAFVIGESDSQWNHYHLRFSDPSFDKPRRPVTIHRSYLRHVKDEEQNEKTKNEKTKND